MNEEDQLLWNRLETFHIGDETAVFGFEHRLARENGWSVDFAERVIEEYKRFMFLAVRAGHRVTPSEEIDQVWHLHLVYTQSYWKEFCKETLHQNINHGPTKGGAAEEGRFEDWYGKTRESYERFFGEAPPVDIWPASDTRFERRQWQWVDRKRNFVIPRPGWLRLPSFRMVSMLLLSIFTLVFLTGCIGNILQWHGTAFLTLYISLLPAALVVSIMLLFLSKPQGKPIERFDSAYDLALVRGGGSRIFAAMLTHLIARGAVEFRPGVSSGGLVKCPRELPEGLEDLTIEEQRFLSAIPADKAISLRKLLPSVKTLFDDMRRRLVSAGQITGDGRRFLNQALIALPMLSLIVLGVAKTVSGVTNGKPVLYLILLMAITFIIMMVAVSRAPRRTRAADAYWKREKASLKQGAKREIAACEDIRNSEVLPLAIAVLGTGALRNVEGLETLHPAIKVLHHKTTQSNSGCGGGCSTGGGGGDGGCGGGGGCGGCGGCG